MQSKPNLPALAIAGLLHLLLVSGGWSGLLGGGQGMQPATVLQVSLLPAPASEPEMMEQTAVSGQETFSPDEEGPPAVTAPQEAARQETATAGKPGLLEGAADYYPASALSQMPEVDGVFQLPTPEGMDLTGQVTVRLWIDAGGNLDRIGVLFSELPMVYQEAAMEAFRKMQYRAGRIGGRPVAAFVDIVVDFTSKPLPELPYDPAAL